ncbi:hypothetical protein TNCV_3947811 [Trichonephila clavipes]|nr:hypothetical protein TNCV_3947811 [Trichonephila clavipes]
MADKEILQFVQRSKNNIDADSDNENKMNIGAAVRTASENRNVMKKIDGVSHTPHLTATECARLSTPHLTVTECGRFSRFPTPTETFWNRYGDIL